MTIQEPIILVGDAGAQVFRTKEDAERYVEPVDIENGIYEAYDAAGWLLDLVPQPGNYCGRITMPDEPEVHRDKVAAELLRMLEHIASVRRAPFNRYRLREHSFDQLVEFSKMYYTK